MKNFPRKKMSDLEQGGLGMRLELREEDSMEKETDINLVFTGTEVTAEARRIRERFPKKGNRKGRTEKCELESTYI